MNVFEAKHYLERVNHLCVEIANQVGELNANVSIVYHEQYEHLTFSFWNTGKVDDLSKKKARSR